MKKRHVGLLAISWLVFHAWLTPVANGEPIVSTQVTEDGSTLLVDCDVEPGAQLSLETSIDLFTWKEEPGLWTGPAWGTLPRFEFRLQDWPGERGYVRMKEASAPPADRDFDRLSDAEEQALGTDPDQADSNGNGVGDWEESRQAGAADARPNPLAVPLTKAHPESPAVTVHRDDRVATVDLDYVAGNPRRLFDIGADGRGAVGYQVTWHPVDAPEQATSVLTSHRRVDIQPLWNEVPYRVEVIPVDRLGTLQSDRSSSGVVQGGSDLRVNQLRAEMTFFDDFNQPQGLPSELNWNSAYATPNNPRFNGLFVNRQYHVHTSTGTRNGGSGDRAQSVHRPRKPLVMEAGETRRIVFDLDGANVKARGIWYLDVLPEQIDITGHSSIGTGDNSSLAYPANGLRLVLNGHALSIVAFDASGQQILIQEERDLHWNGHELFTNVRRHWDIRLSTTSVRILIDGTEVLAADLGEHALDPGEYHLHWNLFAYNSWKVNIPFYVVHWDNFGFDGPDGLADKVVHNYRAQVMGTDYVESADHQPATVWIDIPDDLRPTVPGATAKATLYFTLQRDDFRPYQPDAADRVLVNGQAFPIPRARTNGAVDLDDYDLVSSITPYSMRIPLGELDADVAPLKTGRNELRFESKSCGFHNIHLEIEYPQAAAPPFTESRDLHPVPVHQHYPKPGLSVGIESIGSNPVGDWRGDLNDPAVFNPVVSGVVPILTVANGIVISPGQLDANANHASMAGFGVNPGIRELQLVVRPDGQSDPVHSETLTTRADVPAPQCLHTFSFDTTSLPNGVYEIEVTGLDGRGNRLAPNYGKAGGEAGTVEAYNGFYFPLHVTVEN